MIHIEQARSIISHNDSPDIGFEQSINPYRGCEHECIYCYARPSHAYLNLSPGMDFETQLFAKAQRGRLLRKERSAAVDTSLRRSTSAPILGPVPTGSSAAKAHAQRADRGARRGQSSPADHRQNALVCRDIDLLAPMAAKRLVTVFVSISQLDNDLTRILEPGRRRLATACARCASWPPRASRRRCWWRRSSRSSTTEYHVERVLESAHDAGAFAASCTIIRLPPHELKDLWKRLARDALPDRAERVITASATCGGKENVSESSANRMRGQGIWGDLIRQRFRKKGPAPGSASVMRRRASRRSTARSSVPPAATRRRVNCSEPNATELNNFASATMASPSRCDNRSEVSTFRASRR